MCRIRAESRCRARAQRVDLALGGLRVLPPDGDADRHYGLLRADLERRGQWIGANGMLIAAHAMALDAVLVTDDTAAFSRIGGLRLENWIA